MKQRQSYWDTWLGRLEKHNRNLLSIQKKKILEEKNRETDWCDDYEGLLRLRDHLNRWTNKLIISFIGGLILLPKWTLFFLLFIFVCVCWDEGRFVSSCTLPISTFLFSLCDMIGWPWAGGQLNSSNSFKREVTLSLFKFNLNDKTSFFTCFTCPRASALLWQKRSLRERSCIHKTFPS